MKRMRRVLWFLGRYFLVALLGFVVGILGLYVYMVRSGPALEVWHTEILDGEFTSEHADEVVTLEDYQALEAKLYDRLDAQVYSKTETGPALALARYSAGSQVDPRHLNPDWNRTFELMHEEPRGGVLLLHGMSDSPYSLRAIGESLHRQGYWVVGLRLPGHGTAPSGLTTITWEDMAAAVRLGMRHLAKNVPDDSIHIIGYSTGAPLALNYELDVLDGMETPAPASLVLISPAIGVSPAAAVAKWKRRLSMLPGLQKLAWADILPEFDPFKYNSFAINAGEQVHRLTRSVARRIEARAGEGMIAGFPPTLVLLSSVDATVSTDAVIDNLLEHLAPEGHELFLFDINRVSVKSSILVSDPGPMSMRLMNNSNLPFKLTLLRNENTDSVIVVCHRKDSFSSEVTIEPLDLEWPSGIISLSHVALPFPPDDPLYGHIDRAQNETNTGGIHLGQLAFQGERGLLRFSSDWLLRLRHNPFYPVLESRVLEWLEDAGSNVR
ncbi:MAG: alpha/beta hydrolase [Planctomycetota bacterium]|nr:alpha/beta hydrolase [Planctomycetota bacterium]